MKKQIVGNHKSLYHIEIDHLISIWHKGYLVGSSPAPAMTGAVQKEMGSPNYFKFTREFKSAKI